MNASPYDLALWRHYDSALNAASTALARSRCRVTDREPLSALAIRQRLQLLDDLHSFAYNARRAIELAEEHEPGIIDHARAIRIPGYGETTIRLEIMDDAVPLADQSLWWVLGRIIHARELTIRYFEDSDVGTNWAPAPRITHYDTPIAFAVRSDYDGPEENHIVRIDSFLAAFVNLRLRFAKAFAAVGLPSDEYSPYL